MSASQTDEYPNGTQVTSALDGRQGVTIDAHKRQAGMPYVTVEWAGGITSTTHTDNIVRTGPAQADAEAPQCTAETPTRYCVLDMGHDGQHVDGIATWTSR